MLLSLRKLFFIYIIYSNFSYASTHLNEQSSDHLIKRSASKGDLISEDPTIQDLMPSVDQKSIEDALGSYIDTFVRYKVNQSFESFELTHENALLFLHNQIPQYLNQSSRYYVATKLLWGILTTISSNEYLLSQPNFTQLLGRTSYELGLLYANRYGSYDTAIAMYNLSNLSGNAEAEKELIQIIHLLVDEKITTSCTLGYVQRIISDGEFSVKEYQYFLEKISANK